MIKSLTASGVAFASKCEIVNVIVRSTSDLARIRIYDNASGASGNSVCFTVPLGDSHSFGYIGWFVNGCYVDFESGTTPEITIVVS